MRDHKGRPEKCFEIPAACGVAEAGKGEEFTVKVRGIFKCRGDWVCGVNLQEVLKYMQLALAE